MEFLKSLPHLQESRLLPFDRSYRRYSLRDVLDLIFIYVLALEIMDSEASSKMFTKTYLQRARQDLANNGVRTDLAALIAVVEDKKKFEYLKNASDNTRLSTKIGSFVPEIKNWLASKVSNSWSDSRISAFLYKLERQLYISNVDYKNVRRLVQSWSTLDHYKKQLAFTRILQALRTRAATGDLIHKFEDLSKARRYELRTELNAETGEPNQPMPAQPKSKVFGFLASLAGVAAGAMAGYYGYKKLRESEDVSFAVAEAIVKRIKSELGKEGYFGPASAEIDDIVVDVSNDYGISKVDGYRFFEQHMGKDPQTWYQMWSRESLRSFYETTTAGSVASVTGGFDPNGEWRSIYSNTPKPKKVKKQPIVKRNP
jgi:hypothetical protein